MVAAQSALRTSALLTKALIDARWLTGDAGSLFADAMLMQNLARRVDDGPTLLSMLSARSLRDSTGRIVSSDRVLTSLTEAELTQLTRSLGEFNTAAASARALAGERDRLAAWTPEDIRHLYDHQAVQAAGNSGFSWTAALSSLPRALWSDALIADNQAVITGDLDASLARFDPAGRRYHPPDDTEVSGADAIRRDGGLLNEWYCTIALQTAVPDLFGFGDRLSYDQATTDLAQLSAALELQRRTTGQYPDTLDAIATTLPNGLPHELITGAPYVYQKTPEGGYRLSVPPLPINKSGVEPPVIVRPPAPAPSGR